MFQVFENQKYNDYTRLYRGMTLAAEVKRLYENEVLFSYLLNLCDHETCAMCRCSVIFSYDLEITFCINCIIYFVHLYRLLSQLWCTTASVCFDQPSIFLSLVNIVTNYTAVKVVDTYGKFIHFGKRNFLSCSSVMASVVHAYCVACGDL